MAPRPTRKSTELQGLKQGSKGSGRLIFSFDATMSRQPTWDLASKVQGEMFREAAAIGGLSLQLVFFRGFSDGPRAGSPNPETCSG
jgi:hypothetical protein